MRRKSAMIVRVLMIVCCILLFFGLAAFLLWNRREEQEFIKQIQEEMAAEADVEENGNGTESPASDAAEETETQNSVPDVDTEIADTQEESDVNVNIIEGISFRGDSFCEQENIQNSGFGFYMTELLQDKGIGIPVKDYTMSEAGSMSHMKLAGVSQQVLDSYLAEHQAIAEEETLRITEIKIRDLADEEMTRDDQNYVPVICAGYYGGWVSDPEELCDQLQQILDTYQQKDKYLILGVYPNVYSDNETYRNVMSARWGEHFLCVDGQIEHAISSDEGKKEVAQMVYDKFVELGYIDHE